MPSYDDSVFINCPFDGEYLPLFHAIVFAVHDCGFIARCALEVDDSGQVRIQKIEQIIADCRLGKNIFIEDEERKGVVIPHKVHNPLVQTDGFLTDMIWLRPLPEKSTNIEIAWKLISKDFCDQGKLLLTVNPEYQTQEKMIFVEDSSEERIEEEYKDIIKYS